MGKKRTTLDAVLPATTEASPTAAKAKVVSKEGDATRREDRTPGRRPGVRQQTVYIPIPVHRQFRTLAFEEEVKMHELWLEALDLLFAERGLKSIEECLTEK